MSQWFPLNAILLSFKSSVLWLGFCGLSTANHQRGLPELRKPCLTVPELIAAEKYFVRFSQEAHFAGEITSLKPGKGLPHGSSSIALHPFVDSDGVLLVGGRECNSNLAYSQMHPVILHGKHVLTRLIIRLEHLRLLHAGPTLVFSSLSHRFHVIGVKKTI